MPIGSLPSAAPIPVLPYAYGRDSRSVVAVTPRQARAGRIGIYVGGLHTLLALVLGIGSCVTLGSGGAGMGGPLLIFITAGVLIGGTACSFCSLFGLAGMFAWPALVGEGADFHPAIPFVAVLLGVDLLIAAEAVDRTVTGGAVADRLDPLDLEACFGGRSLQHAAWVRGLIGIATLVVALTLGGPMTLWLTLSLSPLPPTSPPATVPPVAIVSPKPVPPADIDLRTVDLYRPDYGLARADRERVLKQLREAQFFSSIHLRDPESTFDEVLRDVGGHLLKREPTLVRQLAAASRNTSRMQFWTSKAGEMQIATNFNASELQVTARDLDQSVTARYGPSLTHSTFGYTPAIGAQWSWQSLERAVRQAGREDLRITYPQLYVILMEIREHPGRIAPETRRDKVKAPQPTVLKDEGDTIVIAIGEQHTIVTPDGNKLKELPSVAVERQRITLEEALAVAKASAEESERNRLASRILSIPPTLPLFGVVAAALLSVWAVLFAISARRRTPRAIPKWSSLAFAVLAPLTIFAFCVCAVQRPVQAYLPVDGVLIIVAIFVTGMLMLLTAPAIIAASFRRVVPGAPLR